LPDKSNTLHGNMLPGRFSLIGSSFEDTSVLNKILKFSVIINEVDTKVRNRNKKILYDLRKSIDFIRFRVIFTNLSILDRVVIPLIF